MRRNQKTRVLMVYPSFPPSFWSFDQSIKMLGLGAVMPPAGLATVAAMLPPEHFDIMPIVDLNVRPLTDNELAQADLVMISAMVVQRDSFCKTVKQAKKFGKKIAAGGPYPTSYQDEVLDMGVDHLILNEAELTLPPFVEDWLNERAQKIYCEDSVQAKDKTKLSRDGKPLLTDSPVPRWDLLNLSRYSSMSVQFSRGCPFNCEFCDITALFGRESRTKTPWQIISELQALYDSGWRSSVFIVDDNFIGNHKRVRELLPILIEWQERHRHPFTFYTEASLDLANSNMADVLENMVRAGFQEVFVGIESTDADVLTQMNKKQNKGDLGNKVAILQKAGLEVTGGFIIGNDNDKESVFEDMFAFIQNNGVVIAMAGLLMAIKHTLLYKRLRSEGRIRAETSGNNTHQFEFNFEPRLDEKFLLTEYGHLLERLYSSRNYFARCSRQRKRMAHRRRKMTIRKHDLLAALKVTLILTFRRPNLYFIKYMFITLMTAPAKIGEALRQAIQFIHFDKITKAAVKTYRFRFELDEVVKGFKSKISCLKGDAGKCLSRISRLELKTVGRAKKLYLRIDPDFRSAVKETYEEYCRKVKDYADNYRRKLITAPN